MRTRPCVYARMHTRPLAELVRMQRNQPHMASEATLQLLFQFTKFCYPETHQAATQRRIKPLPRDVSSRIHKSVGSRLPSRLLSRSASQGLTSFVAGDQNRQATPHSKRVRQQLVQGIRGLRLAAAEVDGVQHEHHGPRSRHVRLELVAHSGVPRNVNHRCRCLAAILPPSLRRTILGETIVQDKDPQGEKLDGQLNQAHEPIGSSVPLSRAGRKYEEGCLLLIDSEVPG